MGGSGGREGILGRFKAWKVPKAGGATGVTRLLVTALTPVAQKHLKDHRPAMDQAIADLAKQEKKVRDKIAGGANMGKAAREAEQKKLVALEKAAHLKRAAYSKALMATSWPRWYIPFTWLWLVSNGCAIPEPLLLGPQSVEPGV